MEVCGAAFLCARSSTRVQAQMWISFFSPPPVTFYLGTQEPLSPSLAIGSFDDVLALGLRSLQQPIDQFSLSSHKATRQNTPVPPDE